MRIQLKGRKIAFNRNTTFWMFSTPWRMKGSLSDATDLGGPVSLFNLDFSSDKGNHAKKAAGCGEVLFPVQKPFLG